MATYQILVKLLDGNTRCLQFPSPTLTGETLKQVLSIGPDLRLATGTLELSDETLIAAESPSNLFPSVSLLPRLRGGKGGFGSLLRGAATKAGQKKTNNFDACRDMSGRRLRHVNAEKKLEEWKAEAEDRRLEKLADEFLKKKAKEIKKGKGKDREVEKYLEKYRQDSEKCMEAVDESVRESFALYMDGKRKVLPAAGGSAIKRMKIWFGKKKVDEDESDSDDDDKNEDDKDKSVVLNGGTCTVHDKEEEGTSVAVLGCANSDGESSSTLSEQSNVEDVNGSFSDERSSVEATEKCKLSEANEKCDLESPTVELHSAAGESNTESDVLAENEVGTSEEVAAAGDSMVSAVEEVLEMKETKPVAYMSVNREKVDEEVFQTASHLEEPLNFDEYDSAAELEALGMERLKAELQSHGLKCGGTLQERAARLFLLKTTPFEKLPKKVLAAKAGGK